MIRVKSPREVELMRRAGKLTAAARALAREMVRPGATTLEIDREVFKFIKNRGGTPSFLHYNGFPASMCISVNDEVTHGIPGKRKLREGDIVSLDLGAKLGGFHGDCGVTVPCGAVSAEAQKLIAVTRQCFYEGLRYAKKGFRVSDISHAIQVYAEQNGYGVVRAYIGHGVGADLHEDPEVPNFGDPGHGPRLAPGMTLAVEPMINAGGPAIRVLGNNWTAVTVDGSNSAYYENTILITDGEPEILTVPEV
ncbi:MAG: type I methionyl aminopeptidase [Firmicutes bacterium]|nr:type I methionyl aminopeptidase [Bacillota bacterium]